MTRASVFTLLLAFSSPTVLTAQQQPDRATLIRSGLIAADSFDFDRAVLRLTAGLDPSLGAPDLLWRRCLARLTEVYLNLGRDSIAAYFMRWAIRLDPEFVIDREALAGSAFAAARAFVDASSTDGDSLVTPSWGWAEVTPTDTAGRLRITPIVLPIRAQIIVGDEGPIEPGSTQSVPSGSYEVEVQAPGYQPIRVTREVLPGITTVLAFRPIRADIAQQEAPPGTPQIGGPRRGGGFPVPVALLGILGAGAAAVFLLTGGDDPGGSTAETGGIIINLPRD